MNFTNQDNQSVGTHAPKPSSYYLHARPEILALVPLTARKVLDVGCGAGGLSVSLKARQLVEVHGVELVEQAAAHARNHLDQVCNSTIEEALPNLPNGYYDCIVIADVLEHLLDPWAVLSELKQKLANNGKLVASIPNIQNWGVLSALLQGKWDYRNEGLLDRTHLRFFTRNSIQELFWSAGLRISNLSKTESGPIPPTALLQALTKSGLSAKELSLDGQCFQFLISAEPPTPSALPKVAVVILNWNGRTDTLECLTSVTQMDYLNYEIVVVDNGSTDDSVAAITKQYPGITLIQTGSNLGYAGGNNVGIQHVLNHGADFVLLLNNDTTVPPDLLSAFVVAKDLLPANTVLGAKSFFYDKPDTLWFAGGRWNSGSNSFEHIGYGHKDSADFNLMTEVDYITGCALFASTTAFKEIGLLEEDFFLTYEETDWCYRARAKGYKCIFVPNAKLWHKVSSSFGGNDSPLHNYFMVRNKLLWAKKHLPRSARARLRKNNIRILRKIFLPRMVLFQPSLPSPKSLLWGLYSWVRAVKRNINNPGNKSTLFGLRDYYLGRFGNCPEQVRKLKNPTA